MSLCKRIIGCVLIENGLVVRRVGFKTASIVGQPRITIKYLQNWDVDELFFINVGKKQDISLILQMASEKCFLPITVGGSISSLDEVDNYIKNGADKVVIGKHASFDLLSNICNRYGNQSVCLSIDKDHDKIPEYPCGEIIMHDASRDGIGNGLNLYILKEPVYKNGKSIHKPIIAMGGVGRYEDIVEGLNYADAVAVGNLFHFKEISAKLAKAKAREAGILVRG